MNKQQVLYDVYVSYPPNLDRGRIDACIRDNLSEAEAEALIQSLSEKPQVIIAEWCTREEWENAQHYFSYLGLDVITRQSMELAAHEAVETDDDGNKVPQCPVCYTIIEHTDSKECPTCGFSLHTGTEASIQLKRIEWQERIAFESRRQREIAYKLQKEQQTQENRLRKKIRGELEQTMRQEAGSSPLPVMKGKKLLLAALLLLVLIAFFIALGYVIAQIL